MIGMEEKDSVLERQRVAEAPVRKVREYLAQSVKWHSKEKGLEEPNRRPYQCACIQSSLFAIKDQRLNRWHFRKMHVFLITYPNSVVQIR